MAVRRRSGRQTFGSILRQVAPENASRLMEKARTANRVAKAASGSTRRRAYRVKTDALVNLARSFTDQVFVSEDPRTPRYVLVRNVRARFGLHAPASYFERSVRG